MPLLIKDPAGLCPCCCCIDALELECGYGGSGFLIKLDDTIATEQGGGKPAKGHFGHRIKLNITWKRDIVAGIEMEDDCVLKWIETSNIATETLTPGVPLDQIARAEAKSNPEGSDFDLWLKRSQACPKRSGLAYILDTPASPAVLRYGTINPEYRDPFTRHLRIVFDAFASSDDACIEHCESPRITIEAQQTLSWDGRNITVQDFVAQVRTGNGMLLNCPIGPFPR